MTINLRLLLESVQEAFANGQTQHGQFLLTYAMQLADAHLASSPSSLDAAIGLDRGFVREANEDCVVAFHGTRLETHDPFGLFVVCDGVGGHVHGLEAAHLACQTLMEHVVPRLLSENPLHECWTDVLAEGVRSANRAVYQRNCTASPAVETRSQMMATTVTAALLVGETVFVANVGDSRTYLYHPDAGLRRITHDHSVVADIFCLSDSPHMTPEEIYTHPRRNQITRSLGLAVSVEVDTFVQAVQADDILLLCSDGLWEMTRDPKIESVLAMNWASSKYMVNRLLALAKEGGGKDNIGLLVVQVYGRQKRGDISTLSTQLLSPIQGLTRVVPASV